MSMAPNNPFDSPDSNSASQAPPPKKSNTWLWIFGIIGGLGLLVVMICCGASYFAISAGTQVLADEIKLQVGNDPVIKEHIGDVESVSLDFWETVAEAQRQQKEGKQGNEKVAFSISGSKGSGKILGSQSPDGIGEMELVLPDGSRHKLETSLSSEPDMDLEDFDLDDIDMGETIDVPEPAAP